MKGAMITSILFFISIQVKDWQLDDGLTQLPNSLESRLKWLPEGTASNESKRVSRRFNLTDRQSGDYIRIEIGRIKDSAGLDQYATKAIMSGQQPSVINDGFSGLTVGKISRHTHDPSDMFWFILSFARGWDCSVSYSPRTVSGVEADVRANPPDGTEPFRVEGIARVLMGRMLAKDCAKSNPITIDGTQYAAPYIGPNGTFLLNLTDWAKAFGAKLKLNLDMTFELTKDGKTILSGLGCAKAKVKAGLVDLEDLSIMVGEDIYIPYQSVQVLFK